MIHFAINFLAVRNLFQHTNYVKYVFQRTNCAKLDFPVVPRMVGPYGFNNVTVSISLLKTFILIFLLGLRHYGEHLESYHVNLH